MGFLSDAYTWIDANLAGGILPGGHEITAPGATIGGVIPTPFVGIQPAAPAPAPVAAQVPQVPTITAAGLPVGVARPGALAAPLGLPPGLARGRLQTLVARMMPDGTVIPVRTYPGRPALMSSDITAAKRVRRIGKMVNKLFPSRTRGYKSKRTQVVYRSRSRK